MLSLSIGGLLELTQVKETRNLAKITGFRKRTF